MPVDVSPQLPEPFLPGGRRAPDGLHCDGLDESRVKDFDVVEVKPGRRFGGPRAAAELVAVPVQFFSEALIDGSQSPQRVPHRLPRRGVCHAL